MDTFLDHTPKIRAGEIPCEKTRRLKIMKTVRRLQHACNCTDEDCTTRGCDEMKSTVVHFRVCPKLPKKQCHICRQLIALCRYHAKRSRDCESDFCPVPYCAKFKQMLGIITPPERIIETENTASEIITRLHFNFPEPNIFHPHMYQNNTNATITSSSEPPTDDAAILTQNVAQLAKLLHAYRCLRNEVAVAIRWPCFESNCGIMKQVAKHITKCRHGTNCTSLLCVSSKSLMEHWRSCVNAACELCRRVRHSMEREGPPPMRRINEPRWRRLQTDRHEEWHRLLSPIIRDGNVDKFFALSASQTFEDVDKNRKSYREAIVFAERMEIGIFNRSNSLDDYHSEIARVVATMEADNVIAARLGEIRVPEVVEDLQMPLFINCPPPNEADDGPPFFPHEVGAMEFEEQGTASALRVYEPEMEQQAEPPEFEPQPSTSRGYEPEMEQDLSDEEEKLDDPYFYPPDTTFC